MKEVIVGCLAFVILGVLLFGTVFFTMTQTGRTIINEWQSGLKKTDLNTRYEGRKQVEDTARAMISSYNADKQTFEMFKDSNVEQEISLANSAMIKANTTVATYNNFILKNSYMWENNIPSDIYYELQYLKK